MEKTQKQGQVKSSNNERETTKDVREKAAIASEAEASAKKDGENDVATEEVACDAGKELRQNDISSPLEQETTAAAKNNDGRIDGDVHSQKVKPKRAYDIEESFIEAEASAKLYSENDVASDHEEVVLPRKTRTVSKRRLEPPGHSGDGFQKKWIKIRSFDLRGQSGGGGGVSGGGGGATSAGSGNGGTNNSSTSGGRRRG